MRNKAEDAGDVDGQSIARCSSHMNTQLFHTLNTNEQLSMDNSRPPVFIQKRSEFERK